MVDLVEKRREAQRAVLDLFTVLTGIPIGMREIPERGTLKNGTHDEIIPEHYLEHSSRHCREIQRYPEGKKRCTQSMCERWGLGDDGEAEITRCWAGLFNQKIVIRVEGRPRAVLLFGEMQVKGDDEHLASLASHQQAMSELGLTPEQAEELRTLLFDARTYSHGHIATLKAVMRSVEQALISLFIQHDRVQQAASQNSHELQIRLQAVLARAENLCVDFDDLLTTGPSAVKSELQALLSSTLELCTVAETFGGYLDDYSFSHQPLLPLITEATQTFAVLAEKRGIDIRYHLAHGEGADNPWLEISRKQLQHAINNLVHNAVKYSFTTSTSSKHRRSVDIIGRFKGNQYVLAIENYGIGIQRDELERIFWDGYRGTLTQNEYRSGAGKGLTYAQQVIERHNGRIVVDSFPLDALAQAEGLDGTPHLTRVTVYLPRKQPTGHARTRRERKSFHA